MSQNIVKNSLISDKNFDSQKTVMEIKKSLIGGKIPEKWEWKKQKKIWNVKMPEKKYQKIKKCQRKIQNVGKRQGKNSLKLKISTKIGKCQGKI